MVFSPSLPQKQCYYAVTALGFMAVPATVALEAIFGQAYVQHLQHKASRTCQPLNEAHLAEQQHNQPLTSQMCPPAGHVQIGSYLQQQRELCQPPDDPRQPAEHDENRNPLMGLWE